MPILALFAFIGGIVTILSPCILPILPIVLSGSLSGGKRRPLGVVIGFVLSFTFFATFSFALARSIGLSSETLRQIAVIVLTIFGLSLVIPSFQEWMERVTSNFVSKHQVQGGSGFKGGLLLGLSLGFIWTPCVGPILASVLTVAATSTVTLELLFITFAYSLGTAIPLFLIAYGGKRVLSALPSVREKSGDIQRAFGFLILLAALVIQFNLDRRFQTFILEKFPSYGEGITSIEDNALVREQLEKLGRGDEINLENTQDMLIKIDDMSKDMGANYPLAPNPDFEGATRWLNSDPLTLDKLENKVVLVDFWTYTCINCIRTFPYITSWYEKYKDDGFMIIGVHTPEFEFEKNPENVLDAMKQYNITYPVVQDNDYRIWRSYNNRYWPAHYLIDKNGKIRYTHFGEGEYDKTERKIQELLEETGSDPEKEVLDIPSNLPQYRRTPESYLGYARIDRLATTSDIVKDAFAAYETVKTVPLHYLGYAGRWKVGREHGLSSKDARIILNFEAKEVFLVMRPAGNTSGKVRVYLNGKVISPDTAGEDVQDGVVTVESDRLYKLVRLDNVEQHLLELQFIDGPVEVFAFTFG